MANVSERATQYIMLYNIIIIIIIDNDVKYDDGLI